MRAGEGGGSQCVTTSRQLLSSFCVAYANKSKRDRVTKGGQRWKDSYVEGEGEGELCTGR